MENKYYTPELKEFHVGFEFETNYLEKNWVKKTLEFDDFGFYSSTYDVDSCKTEFRVRHLDKEDIESLGFIEDEKFENNFTFKDFILYIEDSIITIANNEEYEMYISFFIGTIKNKSELKRLMEQLNINTKNG